MSSLGTDVGSVTGVPRNRYAWVSGRDALVRCLVRRLGQPGGKLHYWRGYGRDLRALVGTTVSTSVIEQLIEGQFMLDERVSSVRASATRDEHGTITIRCEIDDGAGAFQLVLSASAANVSLLSIQGQNG